MESQPNEESTKPEEAPAVAVEQAVPAETKSEKKVTLDTPPPPESSGVEVLPSRSLLGSAVGKSSHGLKSKEKGESFIEKLAAKIEGRRESRIPITFYVRKTFLTTCRKIVDEENEKNKSRTLRNKIPFDRLLELYEDAKQKVEGKPSFWGYRSADQMLFELYERGVENGRKIDAKWFFYRDFNFYQTVLQGRLPFFSGGPFTTFFWLMVFYFGSAVFFCAILRDDQVCPCKNSELSRRDFGGTEECPNYEGWLTTVYFASVTMSTVGYGDVSLAGQDNWSTLVGIIYMLVALLIGYTVFAAAAELAIGGFDINNSSKMMSVLFPRLVAETESDETPLFRRVRNITTLRTVELVIYFVGLNVAGMIVAVLFARAPGAEDDIDWNWMTGFYWSVQTTTTIGYGDLSMPFDLRWLNIFFTTLGAAFVGSCFGGIASLKSDISDLRRMFAWKRREVSKRLIEDLKGDDEDLALDQYEFMVGSLLMLNKIDKCDVEQIMDKFRELANEEGYITYTEAENEAQEAGAESGENPNAQEELDDMQIDVDAEAARF